MRGCVVLDKNFLQGVSGAAVMALARRYRLVMPSALFYELLTTSAEARRRCFAKLPQTDNPVVLVDHIGVLLRHESATGKPCGKPSGHRVDFRFRFNDRLLAEDYELPEEAKAVLEEQTKDVESDVRQLIDLAEMTPSLFPGLLVGTTAQQLATRRRAEEAIGQLEQIHKFYSVLQPVLPELRYPVVSDKFKKWAFLRWLQVLMLFALDLYVRYQGKLRDALTPNVLERLEHDVHDAQILVTGVLEGAIATREKMKSPRISEPIRSRGLGTV
jgi:hypothetical protein